jgi:hypothetical protein
MTAKTRLVPLGDTSKMPSRAVGSAVVQVYAVVDDSPPPRARSATPLRYYLRREDAERFLEQWADEGGRPEAALLRP